jgi:hypothetical protein
LSAVVNYNNTTGEEHNCSSIYKNPIKLSSSSSSLLLNNFKYNAEEIINKKLDHQLLRKNKQKFSSYLIYDLNNDSLRYIIKSSINNQSSNTSTIIRDSTTSKQTFNSINNKNQMTLKDMMVLNTEWTQLETIELLNESSSSSTSSSATSKTGSAGAKAATSAASAPANSGVGAHGSGGGGFGFGITGNKSTGVVVKAITPGGSAQRVFVYLFIFINLFLVDFYFVH